MDQSFGKMKIRNADWIKISKPLKLMILIKSNHLQKN